MRHFTLFFLIITSLSCKAQVKDSNIKFILPPNVDSVVNEFLVSLDKAGLVDSYIVHWISYDQGFSQYVFYKIPNTQEFDNNGNIKNQELWFKKRTNRVLKVGSHYEIPLIHKQDIWAYAGDGNRPYMSYQTVDDYSPYFRYDYRTLPVTDVWVNWELNKTNSSKEFTIKMKGHKLNIPISNDP